MKHHESRLRNQPKYMIGHAVRVVVQTNDKATGLSFNNTVEGHISVIQASGTSEIDTYEYGVTLDMPGCYHNGKQPFGYYDEKEITLSEP